MIVSVIWIQGVFIWPKEVTVNAHAKLNFNTYATAGYNSAVLVL